MGDHRPDAAGVVALAADLDDEKVKKVLDELSAWGYGIVDVDDEGAPLAGKVEQTIHVHAGEPIEAREGITLPGIADRVLDELGRVVLEAWPPSRLDEAQGFAALAGAFRDLDAVLARVRTEDPEGDRVRAVDPRIPEAVWEAVQHWGGSSELADGVTTRVVEKLAG